MLIYRLTDHGHRIRVLINFNINAEYHLLHGNSELIYIACEFNTVRVECARVFIILTNLRNLYINFYSNVLSVRSIQKLKHCFATAYLPL